MAILPKRRQRPIQGLIPPLLIGALGTVIVVVLYLFGPGFRPLDLLLMLIIVAFTALGYRQCIARGLMTAAALYVATAIAATLYPALTPYTGAVWRAIEAMTAGNLLGSGPTPATGPHADGDILALSFSLLTVVIWIVLEILFRASFQDARLPRLGVLDKLGGIVAYLAIGTLVASLLFNAIGYGRFWHTHNQALLRPKLNQVLYLHYTTQSFWFPEQPPPIYVYDLNPSHEP